MLIVVKSGCLRRGEMNDPALDWWHGSLLQDHQQHWQDTWNSEQNEEGRAGRRWWQTGDLVRRGGGKQGKMEASWWQRNVGVGWWFGLTEGGRGQWWGGWWMERQLRVDLLARYPCMLTIVNTLAAWPPDPTSASHFPSLVCTLGFPPRRRYLGDHHHGKNLVGSLEYGGWVGVVAQTHFWFSICPVKSGLCRFNVAQACGALFWCQSHLYI